eukprot:jgi/Mesvir1/24699/Mv21982-RA.1
MVGKAFQNIRLLTLDVTGTLIKYHGQLGDYYCMAVTRFGNPCPDYKRVSRAFNVAYQDVSVKWPNFGSRSNIPTIEWWREVVTKSFVGAGYHYEPELMEKIFLRIYRTFETTVPYRLYDDSIPTLEKLRAAGYILGVISNTDERYADRILPRFDLSKYFDFVICSKAAGVEKPDAGIFWQAIERANVVPDQAMHIGDNMQKDFYGAMRCGMKALCIRRQEHMAPAERAHTRLLEAHHRHDPRIIHNLSEVLDLLKSQ